MTTFLRGLLNLFVLGLFLGPLFFLLIFAWDLKFPPFTEFSVYFFSALKQASLSSLFSLTLGCFAALGLFSVERSKYLVGAEFIYLLPALLPSLYMIISSLNLFSFLGGFPFGLAGVVVIHTAINVGAVAVAINHIVRSKASGLIGASAVLGASSLKIYWQLLKMLKKDISLLILTVFIFCFGSFSVPLIVGGLGGATLEVYIYRKILTEGSLSQALVLSIFQILFLLTLSLLISRSRVPKSESFDSISILGSKLSLWVALSFSVLLLSGSFFGVLDGASLVFGFAPIRDQFLLAFWGSMMTSLFTGFWIFVIYTGLSFSYPNYFLRRFFMGYSSPSAVVLGFCFYLMGVRTMEGILLYVCLGLGLSLLFLPAIHRYLGESVMSSLESQVQTALVLGASPQKIFSQILFPQFLPFVLWAAGLSCFWAVGDFAFSSILSSGPSTMGLFVKAYLGGYYMEIATFGLWALLLVGGIFFLTFGVLSRVYSQKLEA